MTPEEKLGLQVEVGNALQIESLLNNEIVKKTLDGLLHGLQNDWLMEQNRDQREILWQQGQGVQLFVQALKSIINTGRMAQAQLSDQEAMENDQSN